jgi:hypothetical protein
MTVSRSVRILHKNGNPMGNTVTSVFTGIEEKKFCRQVEERLTPFNMGEPSALFHFGDLF